jgi:hypothetical protein
LRAGAECLKANVEGQNAQSQLTIGRARDAAGRPDKPYLLRLTSNVCLDADDPDEAVKNTRTIHVFPAEEKLEAAFRRVVGKTVAVQGNPFPAHTSPSPRAYRDAGERNPFTLSAEIFGVLSLELRDGSLHCGIERPSMSGSGQ